MHTPIKRLPDAELKVMQALWHADQPLTRPLLEESIRMFSNESSWAATTILSLLARLENKNFIQRIKKGKGYLYLPLVSREEYLQYESANVLNKIFNNSPTAFMAALYRGKGLSDTEINELEEYLQKIKDGEK